MRTHNQTIRLLIATGMFLLDLVLLNGVSAQSIEDSARKDPASQNQARIGIDVSEFTEMDALGFLSPEKVKPWGHLFSDETERILLARGDTVYVSFEKKHDVKPGDIYTVFKSSSELDHPLSGRDLGYEISFLGKVVLKMEVKPRLFKAEIVECYRPIQIGDPVIPFQPVSPCIQLSNPGPDMPAEAGAFKIPVVAAKDLQEIIGQFSVIYMDHGHRQGINRGNLFQIVSPAENDLPNETALPDQVLGYALVLEARPGTSTGLVITAKREFSSGTMLKSVDLKASLKKLLNHYGLQHNDADLENHPLHVLNRLMEEVGSRTDLPEAFLLLSKMPKCPIQ